MKVLPIQPFKNIVENQIEDYYFDGFIKYAEDFKQLDIVPILGPERVAVVRTYKPDFVPFLFGFWHIEETYQALCIKGNYISYKLITTHVPKERYTFKGIEITKDEILMLSLCLQGIPSINNIKYWKVEFLLVDNGTTTVVVSNHDMDFIAHADFS